MKTMLKSLFVILLIVFWLNLAILAANTQVWDNAPKDANYTAMTIAIFPQLEMGIFINVSFGVQVDNSGYFVLITSGFEG